MTVDGVERKKEDGEDKEEKEERATSYTGMRPREES
jgi:hypothetical protein